MKCTICGASMFKKPLHRTNPVGQPDAGWMCATCIKLTEPELHKNMNDDGDFKVAEDVFDAVNKK